MTRLVRHPHSGNLVPVEELTHQPRRYQGRSPLGAALLHLGATRSLGWSEEVAMGDLVRLTRLNIATIEKALVSIAQREELKDLLAASSANSVQVMAVVAGLVLAVGLDSAE